MVLFGFNFAHLEFIVKGTKSDGFKENTGIQLDKIRIVDKYRIQGTRLGRLDYKKFNEVTEKLIEFYFEPIHKKLHNNITDKQISDDKIKELELEIEKLKSENKILKEQKL